LSAAFGGRNKKRLNRVFDVIGFVYPDYCYPLRGQGIKRKIAASGKIAASAITAEPKGKKMKVLTHRSRYIEPAVIPEFGKGISSAAKAKETVPIMQSTVEPSVVPKITTVEPAKAEGNKAKEPQVERVTKNARNPESSIRGNTVEGAKGFYCDSQEKDGECAGCCSGDYKGAEPCSCKESRSN
jgi:hypothetical protein